MSETQNKTTGENKGSKKRNKVLAVIAAILVVALIAGSFFVNSDYLYNKRAAISIGDVDYTSAEFNYFYYSVYNKFYSELGEYASQIIDKNQSLKDQFYTEGESFHDYFVDAAKAEMLEVTIASEAATAAGLTLSAEVKESIQNQLDSAEMAATLYGKDVDQYLVEIYGKGVNLDVVEKIMTKAQLASAYYTYQNEQREYTADELTANYAANKDDYDIFTYHVVYMANNDDAEATYAAADAIATASSSAEFAQLVRENVPEEQKSFYTDDESTLYTLAGMNLTAYTDYCDWLRDSSRDPGDTTVIKSASGQGYYVLMFVGRETNNYNTANMRHILIQVAADENGEYTDEAKAEAEAKIEEIKEEYDLSDGSEESFAELANTYSQDTGSNTNGGLYENVAKNEMVPPVNDFLFARNRQAGDTDIVYAESTNYAGYHLLYYVGNGPVFADLISENNLRVSDYNEWLASKNADYPIVEHYTMRFVG